MVTRNVCLSLFFLAGKVCGLRVLLNCSQDWWREFELLSFCLISLFLSELLQCMPATPVAALTTWKYNAEHLQMHEQVIWQREKSRLNSRRQFISQGLKGKIRNKVLCLTCNIGTTEISKLRNVMVRTLPMYLFAHMRCYINAVKMHPSYLAIHLKQKTQQIDSWLPRGYLPYST